MYIYTYTHKHARIYPYIYFYSNINSVDQLLWRTLCPCRSHRHSYHLLLRVYWWRTIKYARTDTITANARTIVHFMGIVVFPFHSPIKYRIRCRHWRMHDMCAYFLVCSTINFAMKRTVRGAAKKLAALWLRWRHEVFEFCDPNRMASKMCDFIERVPRRRRCRALVPPHRAHTATTISSIRQHEGAHCTWWGKKFKLYGSSIAKISKATCHVGMY